jgi:type III restriction enzyme
LIQFPSGSEEWIARVKEALANLGYGEKSGLVASWFSGDHPDNPDEIKNLTGNIHFFCLNKQSLPGGIALVPRFL